MYRLLSKNWIGLVIAFVVLGISAILFAAANSKQFEAVAKLLFIGSYLTAGIGMLLVIGALYHLYRTNRVMGNYPPPGEMVDVGIMKMHLLAEGDNNGQPTVLWIPGSHDPGLAMIHLHNKIKTQARSIIYDRSGSGWSDDGPFPKTVLQEVRELKSLLDNSAETGPYVIAAHSLGGLIATNFASHYPQQVAGLVLIDSACPDVFSYTSHLPLSKTTGGSLLLPLLAIFGILWHLLPRRFPDQFDGSTAGQLRLAFQAQPRAHLNFLSALSVLRRDPFSCVNAPEVLGDVPLFAVIPKIDPETHAGQLRPHLKTFSELQLANMVAMFAAAQHRTAQLSTRGELIYSPEGTSHNLPAENPDFVIKQVNRMLERLAVSSI